MGRNHTLKNTKQVHSGIAARQPMARTAAADNSPQRACEPQMPRCRPPQAVVGRGVWRAASQGAGKARRSRAAPGLGLPRATPASITHTALANQPAPPPPPPPPPLLAQHQRGAHAAGAAQPREQRHCRRRHRGHGGADRWRRGGGQCEGCVFVFVCLNEGVGVGVGAEVYVWDGHEAEGAGGTRQ